MIDQNIEDGIERYIRHIRKMSQLTDYQIELMISHVYGQDPDSIGIMRSNIDSYISKIREMSSLSDTQLRSNLRDAANKDPALKEVFEDAAQKKLLAEMKDMAKKIKSDPRKFARKVDKFWSFKGIIINADVNGVYNIISKYLRKGFPNIKFLIDGIEGVRLHPVRVNPLCWLGWFSWQGLVVVF